MGWLSEEGHTGVPVLLLSHALMVTYSFPPVDQSLVMFGYARVPWSEGKLILYHSQAADITEETFSGSAYPRGKITIVVVVKREM